MLGRVASQQPPSTKMNPPIVAAVIASSRNTAPSTTATAGFANVISVERVGPISSIKAKNTTNAMPVQTMARPTIAHHALAGGGVLGRVAHANGAATSAAATSATAITPRSGTSLNRRDTMNGPIE